MAWFVFFTDPFVTAGFAVSRYIFLVEYVCTVHCNAM